MEIPSAPSSCGYYFQTTTFQDSSITVDTNSTYPIEGVLSKNRKWKVDFDNMDIYDLDNNVDRGHILNNSQDDKPVYYIGDSKYYKRNTEVGEESIYKQFTYAKNVIQDLKF